MHRVLFFIGRVIFVGASVWASTGHADPFKLCLNAKTAFEKIERCSVVILHSRRSAQLELAHLRRGNAYMELNRFSDAVKGVSIDPRDVGLLIDRGKVLAKAGLNREAIADFSRALDIDPKTFVAFRERGLVYKKLGNFEAALDDLTWFARFEPKDQEVEQAIDEMQASSSPSRQEEPKVAQPPETKKGDPGVIRKPMYCFAIAGTQRKATETCAEYLELLNRMVAKFKADYP